MGRSISFVFLRLFVAVSKNRKIESVKIHLLACAATLSLPLAAVAAPTQPVAAPAPAKPVTSDPLGIPAFPGVPNEFTFAGTQNDLLGTLQGFVAGAKVEGSKSTSPLFSSVEVLDMVSQIHVLRARSLSFRSKGDDGYDEALKAAPTAAPGTMSGGTMSGGTMSAPAKAPDDPYDREQKMLGNAQKFYADLFQKQGGQAQLTLQNGKTSLAVYVFSTPRSFAVLTRGPSRVIVVRADGLPKLGALGKLFSQIVVAN